MFGLGGNKKGYGPVGVAVSAHDVRLAQRLDGGGYALECEALTAGIDPSSPAYHTETSRAISTALRRGAFVGKEAVSALPAEAMRYKTLRLPPMPAEDLAQAIAWEAAERFQITEDHSLQYYTAGEVAQGNEKREEVILLAAEKQDVYDHASAVKRAGLTPLAVDATGAALARLLGDEGTSQLIISAGNKSVEIIGSRDRHVIFDKPVELSGADNAFDLGSVGRELSLCLRYLSVTFGIHQPHAVWLCGERATPVMAEKLGDTLRTPLKTVDQCGALGSLKMTALEASKWAVALGLAARDERRAARATPQGDGREEAA